MPTTPEDSRVDKEALARLRESEDLLKTVLENIGDAFYALDEDWCFLFVSQSALKLWGKRAEDILDRPLLECFPRVAGSQPYEAQQRVMTSRRAERLETVSPILDRWIEVDISPLVDGGISVAFRDIESRKRADEHLRESEERFASFAASSSDALWVRDAETYAFHYVSPAVQAVYGVTPEAVIANKELLNDLIVPEERDSVSRNVARVSGGEEIAQEYRIQRPTDGAFRWIRSTGFPLRNEKGEIRRIGAIARDITDRRLAEEALRESEERQAFLLKLSDALRAEPDAGAVSRRAITMLSERMLLDRCYVASNWPDADRADILCQVGNERVPPLPRSIRPSDFPAALQVWNETTLVINDVAATPGLTDDDRNNIAALGLCGVISSAVRRGAGNPQWAIVGVSASPRQWSPSDIALIEEVTERSWAAVERARAEAALRESEEHYHSLFDTMGEGVAICRVVRDAQGRVVDLTYEEMNPALERQTGLDRRSMVGRRLSEIFPPADVARWLPLYAKVADTGEPLTFEMPADLLNGRWYEVSAHARGSDQLSIIFREVTERKRAEAALHESQQLLASTFDALPMGIGVLDKHGTMRRMNPQMEYYLPNGIIPSREPARVGRWQGWDTERKPVAPQDFPSARALRGETMVPGLEMLFEGDDGHRLWTQVSSVPLQDENGTVTGAITIVSNIDALKRSEEALRANEEELRVALEAGRMGTYRLDLETGKQSWSDRQYDIFGVPRGTVPTRELFLSLVHPEDHHRVAFTLDDIRKPGTFLDSEFRITRPDGEVRWITAHALALFNADVQPVGLIGVNHDVTEQRRLEAAMHTSEERLRQFGETMTDVMWIRRASDLQWEYLSPAFHKIYGISREDALRGDNYRSWLDLIVPDDRDGALAGIDRVRHGERATFEYRIRRPEDGKIRWLRNTDFPMHDETGKVVRIGGIGHDITEIKQAEEHQRLLHAELQHRVRNTLGVIRSITRRTAATTESKEDLVTHLDGRIGAFARVQAAVTRDATKPLDLAMLVADELRVVGAQEGDNLTITGPALGLRPKAAETFGLAVHELATNAVKYGALSVDGGAISIVWTPVDFDGRPGIRFEWTESGLKGLDPEPQRRGFGTEILERTLAYELHGKTMLQFRPTGLHCTIMLPLERLTGKV